MPENNCSQNMLMRNLCGPVRHESWQKKTKRISDNDELKYWLQIWVIAMRCAVGNLLWKPFVSRAKFHILAQLSYHLEQEISDQALCLQVQIEVHFRSKTLPHPLPDIHIIVHRCPP